MNESKLLNSLTVACEALDLQLPVDLRRELPTNSKGGKYSRRNVPTIKGLVWHQELGDGSIEGVANYHTGSNSHISLGGMESISYTWAIRADGQIVLCNSLDVATWSHGTRARVGDENKEFMSVMFEGLFKGVHVTGSGAHEPGQEQLLAAILLWRVCSVEWNWDAEALYGHYHFGKAACPGYTGQDIIEALRRSPSSLGAQLEYELSSHKSRQQALVRLGYLLGAVDGIWGPISRRALILFQEDVGLEADGVWGPATNKAISEALKGTT